MALVKRPGLVKRDTPAADLDQAKATLDAFKPGTRQIDQRLADAVEKHYTELSARIKIDRNNLDACAEEQAQVFLEICEQHALAVSQRDFAKDQLARTDAEVARDARIDKTKAGEKVTDSIISDHVLLHPKHQAAATEYANARRIEARWGALRDAFDQRMRMIRELVGLYAAGYWTSSGTATARDSVRQAVAENTRDRMAEARKGG